MTILEDLLNSWDLILHEHSLSTAHRQEAFTDDICRSFTSFKTPERNADDCSRVK